MFSTYPYRKCYSDLKTGVLHVQKVFGLKFACVCYLLAINAFWELNRIASGNHRSHEMDFGVWQKGANFYCRLYLKIKRTDHT